MKTHIKTLLAGLAACGIASSALAGTITGSEFTVGATNQNFGDVTFSAGADDGTFQHKTQAGYTGVGLSGAPNSQEIDLDETLTGTFTQQVHIDSLIISVLFDGPEYGDFQEHAQISLWNGTDWLVGDLITQYTLAGLTATWSLGGTLTNLSPATEAEGGVWELNNPFGNALGSQLTFTAQPGICGVGTCTNQSDFAVASVSYSVPEPGTVALLGLGLAGLGWNRRRR